MIRVRMVHEGNAHAALARAVMQYLSSPVVVAAAGVVVTHMQTMKKCMQHKMKTERKRRMRLTTKMKKMLMRMKKRRRSEGCVGRCEGTRFVKHSATIPYPNA